MALQELLAFEISSSDITGLEEEDSQGSGSYGAVYAVTVKGTSRIAKRLHSILVGADVSRSEKQAIREKFLNECLLLSKLDHPNVVKFIGVHFSPRDRSDATLIMERLHMDLDKFLDPDLRPNIDTYTKLSILLDVSSGLLYLHTQLAKPIIHRDLSAGNVLLTEDFKQAKLADLGVSKLIDNYVHRAQTRTICPGTLAYMPPEALTDKPKYDTPLDVFSFGHLALYVALQQFPQVALELSPEQSIRAYQLGEVSILKRKKWLDMIPKDHCLRELILSCLRDDPSERPSTDRLNVKMKVLCGLELEEFEIKDVIGIGDGEVYGSYAAVYEVIAGGAPRIAKRLNSILESHPVGENQRIRERFHTECLSLSKLDHPNIVKFIGVYFNPEDRSDMAVIFEHLHISLEEILNSDEFPDIHLNTKLSILLDISSGLLYLHTNLEPPVVHGELTPANILLTEDLQQAKIADLGLLKLLDKYEHLQQEDGRALAYQPPEVFFTDFKRRTPVDIFSFGHLSLYVALEQFPELSDEEVSTLVRKKRKNVEIEILKRKKWIDMIERQGHCLKDLICSCLRDDQEKRPTAKRVYNIMSELNNENTPKRMTKVSSLCSQSYFYFRNVLPQL